MKLLLRIFIGVICVLSSVQSASASSILVSSATLLSIKTSFKSHLDQIEKDFNRQQEVRCLALGLYHEARGEPVIGQYAVGITILNRVRSKAYPNTVCRVVFQNQDRKHRCQFSFACDDIADEPKNPKSFDKMQKLAHNLIQKGMFREAKFIGHSFQAKMHDMTHYHRHDVSPVWSQKLKQVSQLGAHVFFKSERVTRRYAY